MNLNNQSDQASQVSHRSKPYKMGQWDSSPESRTPDGTPRGTVSAKYLALQLLQRKKMGHPVGRQMGHFVPHPKKPWDTLSPNIPPLDQIEHEEIKAWLPETRRVFTHILAHFQDMGYPQEQAERLSLTTIKVLKERKGWPLVLVQDLPPEIGRAVGAVLEVFPNAKAVNHSCEELTSS